MHVDIGLLLIVIAVLLCLILGALLRIDARLKQRSDKEEDSDWAQADPMGHWEAHKHDKE
jgi:uncharacterized membrane protein YqgA involved in biofilm formation